MPTYITQGRYTREAIKGMIVKPEDRAEALSRHMAKAGGRVMSYYLTFGEYDFLTVIEAPSETQMAAALLAAAGAGGVSDLRTTLAHDLDRGQGRVCRRERSHAGLSVARRGVTRDPSGRQSRCHGSASSVPRSAKTSKNGPTWLTPRASRLRYSPMPAAIAAA